MHIPLPTKQCPPECTAISQPLFSCSGHGKLNLVTLVVSSVASCPTLTLPHTEGEAFNGISTSHSQ